jgi:predicted outer membrane repeat protein
MRTPALSCMLAIATLLVLSSPAQARTWHISPDGSGDAPTIQAGVDSASSGDVVELAPGEYMGDGNRDVDFLGKAITVRSEGLDATQVIILPYGNEHECHRGFVFQSGEGRTSLLEAVTVQDVFAGEICDGGSIRCQDASPTIRRCRFVDNSSYFASPGVVIWGGSPVITECAFLRNTASESTGGAIRAGPDAVIEFCYFEGNGSMYGGAVYSWGNTTISDCVFSHNLANKHGGAVYGSGLAEGCLFDGNTSGEKGGAIWAGDFQIVECTFVSNGSYMGYDGTAVYVWHDADVTIDRSIMAFGGPWGQAVGGEPVLTCCDIYGNDGGDWTPNIASQLGINGNFSADPMFCGDENPEDPYTLFTSSPCLPGHHPQGDDCGVIGARGAGCQAIELAPQTWARVKARYR